MDMSKKTMKSVAVTESKFSRLLNTNTIHSIILAYYFCAQPYAQQSYRRNIFLKAYMVSALQRLIINLGNQRTHEKLNNTRKGVRHGSL